MSKAEIVYTDLPAERDPFEYFDIRNNVRPKVKAKHKKSPKATPAPTDDIADIMDAVFATFTQGR